MGSRLEIAFVLKTEFRTVTFFGMAASKKGHGFGWAQRMDKGQLKAVSHQHSQQPGEWASQTWMVHDGAAAITTTNTFRVYVERWN